MSDNLKTENLGSGLATVSILNSRFEWIDWDKTIRKQLKIAGYGDLLSRQKDRPSNSTKANIWEEKQERACAAVKTRLSPSIERSVEKIENLDRLLEKVKTLLKPNANMAIQNAWDKFNDLSLDDCDGVLDLADRIRKFEADLDQFEIGIPKVLLITKFCKALGAEYSQFLLNHFSGRVLAKLDEGDTSQVADFDDLVFQT
jgi:hypothetical protein